MRASLVSATSIAAVLVLEAGPTMAGPAFDLSVSSAQSTCDNTASPSSCTVNLYALPGQAATGQTVTMTADTKITGTQSFGAAPAGFTGSVSNRNGTLQSGSTFTSNPYGFTGGTTAGSSGQTTTVTGTTTAAVASGGTGKNPAQTSNLLFNGITVAPIESVSSVLQVYARGGSGAAGSAAATVTVSNVGKGNLATGGPSSTSNLNGKIGPVSGTNWTGPAITSFSVQDNTTPGPTSSTFTYTYTPAPTRGSSSTGSVPIAFSNGSSDGKNSSGTTTVSLTGTTVGPVYQSSLSSTVNTPGKNGGSPTSTIDWGTVAKNTTHTEMLTLTNISTDPNGGNANLTNLSIESFNITGKNATNFSINGKQGGTGGVAAVLAENGGSETIDIDFSGAGTGTYDAILQLNTDVDSAFAGPGAFYQYLLTALVGTTAPEPGTALLLGVGLGGLLLLRRRQGRARGTDPSAFVVEQELGSC